MNSIYEDLLWLPQPPEDFSKKLSRTSTGNDLQALSRYRLDESQLRALHKRLKLMQQKRTNLLPLVPVDIGLISNSTTALIIPPLVGTALRFGLELNVVEAGFNQVAQESFASESIFSGKKLTAILVAIDYNGLPILSSPGNAALAEKNVADCLSYIKSIVESLRNRFDTQIILQNIATPVGSMLGSYEGRLPGTKAWIISRLNFELDKLVSQDVFLLDIAGLASTLGLENWHDPKLWNMAKLPFSQRYVPIYADYICRILGSRFGKSRRCLILDLDNTLWGGVIGDDGIEGILIGSGDATAEAHQQIQRLALELRERGIVLAVSSKNEDAVARKPFKEHPDMLIREKHIAVFQANWSDKATNIKAIAEFLSLGLESMVFLDDNPAERMQVRQELPEVAVPELPEDPALYPRILVAAGYFEAIAFSDEDASRANFYQDNATRKILLTQSADMDTYLQSLDMKIMFSPFDLNGRARITQLINKSNQFNLTTRRYSEVDIKKFEDEKLFYTSQIRLKDTFGDNGMIAVVICRKNLNFWEIDTWLMSCRVLGRKVEIAILNEIVRNAKAERISKLKGTYIPTARNTIVTDHYKKLGFTKISEDMGCETWELDVAGYQALEIPMEMVNSI
jgi:FkbH-like protein